MDEDFTTNIKSEPMDLEQGFSEPSTFEHNESTWEESILSPSVSTTIEEQITIGKGLDIGTTNLVSAYQNGGKQISYSRQRNVFIDVKCEPFTRAQVKSQNIPYIEINQHLCVLGETALELANITGREVRQPMHQGVISSCEASALGVVKELLRVLLYEPREEGEPICFSVPSPPVDASGNLLYHKKTVEYMLREIGYTPFPIEEGLAVVYSNLQDRDYSGIGISFGGGMTNICCVYRSIPAVSFSIPRGGDWIDAHVAESIGITTARATLLKERGMNLLDLQEREDHAVAIYYRDLICHVLDVIRNHVIQSRAFPFLNQPLDIVCAGGTTMIGGFIDVFEEELRRCNLPITIGEIRHALDPLNATARGCLLASAIKS